MLIIAYYTEKTYLCWWLLFVWCGDLLEEANVVNYWQVATRKPNQVEPPLYTSSNHNESCTPLRCSEVNSKFAAMCHGYALHSPGLWQCDSTRKEGLPACKQLTETNITVTMKMKKTKMKTVCIAKLKDTLTLTGKRVDNTIPHISGPTRNCSPNIAMQAFSQARSIRFFLSRITHLPPLALHGSSHIGFMPFLNRCSSLKGLSEDGRTR